MEKLQNAIKLFPIITILLVFFGFLNLYFYYKPFGVNIYSYLNSSEIIFSFLPDIQTTLAWIGLVTISFLILIPVFTLARPLEITFSNKESKENEEEEGLQEKGSRLSYYMNNLLWKNFKHLTWKERGKVIWKIISNGNMIWLFILLLFTYYSDFKPCEEPDIFYSLFSIWVISIIMLVLKLFRYNEFIAIGLAYFLFLISFMVYLGIKNECKSQIVKKGKTNIDLSFSYNNEIVKTDTSLFYIGATQNYIFLFDTIRQETNLFKKSDISHIKIKNK